MFFPLKTFKFPLKLLCDIYLEYISIIMDCSYSIISKLNKCRLHDKNCITKLSNTNFIISMVILLSLYVDFAII